MDWEKLNRFQERYKGKREAPAGPPTSSRLLPHKDEILFLDNQGYTLGMIRRFLEEECKVSISRGGIDRFLRTHRESSK